MIPVAKFVVLDMEVRVWVVRNGSEIVGFMEVKIKSGVGSQKYDENDRNWW